MRYDGYILPYHPPAVRTDDGKPTQARERFAEILPAIQEACPGAIMIPSTGGATGMTPEERLKPEIINGSRRKRIAKGCGLGVEDINRLLKQFDQMKKLMKQLSGMNPRRMRGMRLPF